MTSEKLAMMCISVAVLMLIIGALFYMNLDTDKVSIMAQFSALMGTIAVVFACNDLPKK